MFVSAKLMQQSQSIEQVVDILEVIVLRCTVVRSSSLRSTLSVLKAHTIGWDTTYRWQLFVQVSLDEDLSTVQY